MSESYSCLLSQFKYFTYEDLVYMSSCTTHLCMERDCHIYGLKIGSCTVHVDIVASRMLAMYTVCSTYSSYFIYEKTKQHHIVYIYAFDMPRGEY